MRSINSKIFFKLNNKLPVLFSSLVSVVLLQTVNRSSRDQWHQTIVLIELLTGLNTRISSNRNSHASSILSSLFDLFMVVLNRLYNSDFDWLLTFLNKLKFTAFSL